MPARQDVASTDMLASPEARRAGDKEVEEWKAANKVEFERQVQRRKERLPTMRAEPVNLDFEGGVRGAEGQQTPTPAAKKP